MFERSLPYAIRVAHRFDYRWPIFFDLASLDIIGAEAEPGKGGETDVAGLYALVMLHAHEMFGDERYLDEAKAAADRLEGLGFELAYQLNTTGFAAEAAMRLWKTTKAPHYLALSEVCMANLFDNMWLWRCEYGNARHYQTFFGLFPLRDAPYLAPYEELEAHGKFHEYLALGGDDVRPSLRLLIAEFQKHGLDRGWYYFPDALPADAVAIDVRNGRNLRELCVPLEDLRDGFEQSGQVGQEIYGAGLPFVYTSRHYMAVAVGELLVYCNYPAYDFREGDGTASWTVGGDPRGSCELRIIPAHPNLPATAVRARTLVAKAPVPLSGSLSCEGHAVFTARGGQVVTIAFSPPAVTVGRNSKRDTGPTRAEGRLAHDVRIEDRDKRHARIFAAVSAELRAELIVGLRFQSEAYAFECGTAPGVDAAGQTDPRNVTGRDHARQQEQRAGAIASDRRIQHTLDLLLRSIGFQYDAKPLEPDHRRQGGRRVVARRHRHLNGYGMGFIVCRGVNDELRGEVVNHVTGARDELSVVPQEKVRKSIRLSQRIGDHVAVAGDDGNGHLEFAVSRFE